MPAPEPPTLPPDYDPLTAPPVPEAPPVTVGTRLRFAAALAWAALVTVPFSVGVLVHYRLRPSVRVFKRWMTAWARLIVWGAGLRVQARYAGARLPDEQPAVFVANHQSELDIVTIAAALDHPYGYMAKASLQRVPFLGWVLGNTACLFVDRSDPRRAVDSLRQAAERIRGGHSVLIFCEGGRSWRRELMPFLRGAFMLAVDAQVPLVPVTVVNNYELLDERRAVGRAGTAEVVIGAPIPMVGRGRRDVPAVMAEVRAEMEAALGLA